MAVISCENANDTIITYYNNWLYVLYTETNVTYFKNAFHSQWLSIKSHTVQYKITKFHEHLIMGVDALSTPPSHAVYQSLKESLWYCLQLCHKHTDQMCMIGAWGMVTSKSTSHACSMGFNSGEYGGQSILLALCCLRKSVTTLAR